VGWQQSELVLFSGIKCVFAPHGIIYDMIEMGELTANNKAAAAEYAVLFHLSSVKNTPP